MYNNIAFVYDEIYNWFVKLGIIVEEKEEFQLNIKGRNISDNNDQIFGNNAKYIILYSYITYYLWTKWEVIQMTRMIKLGIIGNGTIMIIPPPQPSPTRYCHLLTIIIPALAL